MGGMDSDLTPQVSRVAVKTNSSQHITGTWRLGGGDGLYMNFKRRSQGLGRELFLVKMMVQKGVFSGCQG